MVVKTFEAENSFGEIIFYMSNELYVHCLQKFGRSLTLTFISFLLYRKSFMELGFCKKKYFSNIIYLSEHEKNLKCIW